MIAVIADDLTGAAEIAGLGWRHGLKAEILGRHEPLLRTGADLVAYDSDSRDCSPAEARRRVTGIIRRVQRHRPDWLFKKVDSVLRGNVVVEIETLMQELALRRCILVPANPAAGRVIRRGSYFIHGTPLERTDFRSDPCHPRFSSKVAELLVSSRKYPVTIRKPTTRALPTGIIVGEAAELRDINRWSLKLDAQTLPAGGADFFTALLRQHGLVPRASSAPFTSAARTLFVSGSPAESSARFHESCRAKGWPVLWMPDELLAAGSGRKAQQDSWARRIVDALNRHRQVVLGIGRPPLPGKRTPIRLGRRLIETVKSVLSATRLDRVCVEGGATAALLVRKLGWSRLIVQREFSTGVTAARPWRRRSLVLVFKPGSYAWPSALTEQRSD